MPDFAKPQGGFAAGEVARNLPLQLLVIEEWGDGQVSETLGSPFEILSERTDYAMLISSFPSLVAGVHRSPPASCQRRDHLQRDDAKGLKTRRFVIASSGTSSWESPQLW